MQKKPKLSLLSPTFLRQVALVREHGDEKYGPLPQCPGRTATDTVDAIIRHALEYLEGCDADEESGLHPLAHIAARVNVALYQMERGVFVDNREGKPQKFTQTITTIDPGFFIPFEMLKAEK